MELIDVQFLCDKTQMSVLASKELSAEHQLPWWLGFLVNGRFRPQWRKRCGLCDRLERQPFTIAVNTKKRFIGIGFWFINSCGGGPVVDPGRDVIYFHKVPPHSDD